VQSASRESHGATAASPVLCWQSNEVTEYLTESIAVSSGHSTRVVSVGITESGDCLSSVNATSTAADKYSARELQKKVHASVSGGWWRCSSRWHDSEAQAENEDRGKNRCQHRLSSPLSWFYSMDLWWPVVFLSYHLCEVSKSLFISSSLVEFFSLSIRYSSRFPRVLPPMTNHPPTGLFKCWKYQESTQGAPIGRSFKILARSTRCPREKRSNSQVYL
jgi:hypothetical protein